MSFTMENGEDVIEIDFNNKTIKGKCKAKDFPKQIQKVKDAFE